MLSRQREHAKSGKRFPRESTSNPYSRGAAIQCEHLQKGGDVDGYGQELLGERYRQTHFAAYDRRIDAVHGISKVQNGVAWMMPDLTARGISTWVAYGVYVGEVAAPILVIAGLFTRSEGSSLPST